MNNLGCLDYIFYTDKINVVDMDQVYQEKPDLLPSLIFPSDHLPLHAEFEINS